MSIVNKKVTAPISLWEVARLVRSTLLDLYTVCRSPYINKWSKVKPMKSGKISELNQIEFDNNSQPDGRRYGIQVSTIAGEGKSIYDRLKNIHTITWEYDKPSTDSYSRLTDFNGYNHIAKHNPLVTYKLPTFNNKGRIELKFEILDDDSGVYDNGSNEGINTFEFYGTDFDSKSKVLTYLKDNCYPYVLVDKQLKAMKCKATEDYKSIAAENRDMYTEFYVDLEEGAFNENSNPVNVSFFLVNKVPLEYSAEPTLLCHKARYNWTAVADAWLPDSPESIGCGTGYTIIPLADATGLSKTFVNFDNCSAEAEYSFVTDGTNHYLRIDKVKFNGVEEESVVASVDYKLSISALYKSLVNNYEIALPKIYKVSKLLKGSTYDIRATYNGKTTIQSLTYNGFGDYNWDFNDDFWKQQFEAGEIADFNEDFNKDFKV